jgi:hypothetical protein
MRARVSRRARFPSSAPCHTAVVLGMGKVAAKLSIRVPDELAKAVRRRPPGRQAGPRRAFARIVETEESQ